MDTADLKAGLELTGYPVAYYEFKGETSTPFIVYYFAEDITILADNSNYVIGGVYNIELYTNAKDPAAEAAVETQLRALGLTFGKTETWIDSEALNLVLYTVRLI